jgi:undecaprenyl-diphosphatase
VTTGRDRTERAFLAGGLALVGLLVVIAALTGLVQRGRTLPWDEAILRSLRHADDPSRPIGPVWLRGAAQDVTALGSGFVLGLAVVAIGGFLVLQGRGRTALFVVAASSGGWFLNSALKELFQRARPEVVPHLSQVLSLSFPSGHAMTSAAVYLTLGALLMRIADDRLTKVYCMTVAILATIMIGASRVYLGVHYPTDVAAGWLIGLSWAMACLMIERAIERRTGISRERPASQDTRRK